MEKPMTIQSEEPISLNRRQVVQLAAAALLVAGCASVSPIRGGSDFDEVNADLQSSLDEIADSPGEQVRMASIARRIENRSRALVAEQEEFTNGFNIMLNTRDITEAQLTDLIDGQSERREWLRHDIFRLQDELHAELTPEEWTEVVEVLNRKGETVARSNI